MWGEAIRYPLREQRRTRVEMLVNENGGGMRTILGEWCDAKCFRLCLQRRKCFLGGSVGL
jgi:hypothetical protein